MKSSLVGYVCERVDGTLSRQFETEFAARLYCFFLGHLWRVRGVYHLVARS